MKSVFTVFVLLILTNSNSLFAQNTQIPSEITRFYAERNVVAMISTPQERITVVERGIDADTTPERLKRVYRLLSSLNQIEEEVDPDMIFPKTGRVITVPAEVVRTSRILSYENNRLEIEVEVFPLGMEKNLQFITSYESGKSLPEFGITENYLPATRSIHVWTLKGGQWIRQAAGKMLLSEPANIP